MTEGFYIQDAGLDVGLDLLFPLFPQCGALSGAAITQDEHPAAQPGASLRRPQTHSGPQSAGQNFPKDLQGQSDYACEPRVCCHCWTHL